MKRLFAAVSSFALALCFALAPLADGSEGPPPAPEETQAWGTTEIAIMAAVMFAVIAVVGVLFMKSVQKDRNDIRGIRRK
jgi:hypothetical protein